MSERSSKEKGRGGGSSSCDNDAILSRSLSHPDDRLHLSELFSFLRCHIEAFVVSPDIDDPKFRRLNGKISVGRVGLRCAHCGRNTGGRRHRKQDNKTSTSNGGPTANPPVLSSRDGAVSYPKQIRLVYMTFRRLQRIHLMCCPAVPQEVKDRCKALKTPKGRAVPRSGIPTEQYWEDCCRKMGMIDTDTGIQLRTGRFIVDDVNNREGDKGPYGVGASPPASNQVSTAEKKCGLRPASASPRMDSSNRSSTEVEHNVTSQNDEGSELVCIPTTTPAPTGSINASNGAHGSQLDSSHESAQPFSLNQQKITSNDEEKSCVLGDLFPLPKQGEFASAKQGLALSGGTGSFLLQHDVLMERISVARRLAQTLKEVCPPTEDDRYNDLSYLGAELFKLFSGRNPSDNEGGGRGPDGISEQGDETHSTNDDGSDEYRQSIHRRTKRERTHEKANYISLIELGLPSSLCLVISNLLSQGQDKYQSIEQVEEDLTLMATVPDKYIFGDATGSLSLGTTAIFGREKEIADLLNAFDEANDADSSTNSMVIVTGYSGVGKSSLIQHVRQSLVAKGACFVSGKFDAMQAPQPLSAIASAMNDYCDILAHDEERIATVRDAVANAIGNEGNCLSNMIPNFRKIVPLGDSPPIQVQGMEALQRLLFTFRMLFWASCSKSHPVVLFLDDLQWADKVSLEVMQVLVTDTMIEGLIVIGSYRDNEVGIDHPLTAHLGNIRSSGCVNITSIHLGNLDINSVTSMVSNTLCLMPGTVRPLAEVVINKTGGNALFAAQFLSTLHDDGLLHFSLTSKRWEWDVNRIREKDIADNCVELMVSKLLGLAPEIQEALSVAASFGSTCKETLLRIVDRVPESFTSTILSLEHVAVSEGLMVKTDKLAYRFSHDQIQHAAYLLIPESERNKFHLKIGRLLWKSSSADELEEYLFVVVDQLHRGSCLITDHKEKMELAELSLLAGRMATATSAFDAAGAYLKAGVGLLNEEDWIGWRGLCLDLYNSLAELEFILGQLDSSRNLLEKIVGIATTLQEKLRPYDTLCKLLSAQGKRDEAICSCTEILRHLGESFTRSVTPLTVQKELVATQKLLSRRSDHELQTLESMQYAEKKEAMKFLEILVNLVVIHKKELFPLVVCRMVQISVLHGVCRESAWCFPFYGVILCGHLNNLDNLAAGYRFGKLGLTIMDRFGAKEDLGKICILVYGLLNNWVEPLQSSLPELERAVDINLAVGDTYNAIVSSTFYLGTAFCSGEPLEQLLEKSHLFAKRIAGFQQYALNISNKTIRQVILNLLGRAEDPSELIGEEIDVRNHLQNATDNVVSTQIHFYCLYIAFLFGQYDRAWEAAAQIKDVEKTAIARFPIVCNYAFYSGLTAMALARRDGSADYMSAIDKSMGQMEVWATSTEWNCRHKLELMRAEYAFLKGDMTTAVEEYNSAISSASRHRFVHEQAVALEKLGMFFLSTGQQHNSFDIFERAYECYNKWGALGKASWIRELYL